MKSTPRYVIIAGPTASGKTDLAMQLSQSFAVEIVSADSMMVYRGMDIGTAKPNPRQRKVVPHHLIDILDPDEHYDAATFSLMASDCIARINASGRLPLVVGGTGLYLRALERGLVVAPPRNETLRRHLSDLAAEKGKEFLYRRLIEVDPDSAAKISSTDLVRIIRALEIFHGTGTRASRLREAHGFRTKTAYSLYLVLDMPGSELRERIRRRAQWMIENGLVEEVRKLLAMGYGRNLKPMRALGYRHAIKFLDGRSDEQKLLDEMDKDTWRFARRQIRWFRSEADAIFVPRDLGKVRQCVDEFLSQSSDHG